MTDRDSWERYEKMVIDKLDDHTRTLETIHKELIKVQVEMGIVKTKLALIGILSGMVSGTVISVIVSSVMHHIS